MATHYDAIMTLLCSSILLYTKCGVLVFPSLNDIHVSLFFLLHIEYNIVLPTIHSIVFDIHLLYKVGMCQSFHEQNLCIFLICCFYLLQAHYQITMIQLCLLAKLCAYMHNIMMVVYKKWLSKDVLTTM